MIQRRLLSFVFILLFAFAQQQALLHSYIHLSDSQESSSSEKHGQTHSEFCEKCISIAGIGAAIGSQTHAILFAAAIFALAFFLALTFFSSTYRTYQSRAPPSPAQA
jgi:hypothetical protein